MFAVSFYLDLSRLRSDYHYELNGKEKDDEIDVPIVFQLKCSKIINH